MFALRLLVIQYLFHVLWNSIGQTNEYQANYNSFRRHDGETIPDQDDIEIKAMLYTLYAFGPLL